MGIIRTISEKIRGRESRDGGRKIGICGQAPSDYPSFRVLLVREGVDSVSSQLTTLGRLKRRERRFPA